MGFVAPESPEGCRTHGLGEGYMLNKGIKAREGCDVTGSWDKASLYALWTGASSGTGLFRDVVVALTVSVCVFQVLCFINIF
jgi:hypothetical protein